jgi:hypothetical protein
MIDTIYYHNIFKVGANPYFHSINKHTLTTKIISISAEKAQGVQNLALIILITDLSYAFALVQY